MFCSKWLFAVSDSNDADVFCNTDSNRHVDIDKHTNLYMDAHFNKLIIRYSDSYIDADMDTHFDKLSVRYSDVHNNRDVDSDIYNNTDSDSYKHSYTCSVRLHTADSGSSRECSNI